MKVRTRVVLVLTMIAALLASAPGASAQTPEEQEPYKVTSQAQTADSLVNGRNVIAYEPQNDDSLRQGLKLPDVSAERLLAEGSRNNSLTEYGENMLDSEMREIETRVSLLDESDKIREITAKVDEYGGMYLDHGTGQLVINMASPDARKRSDLEKLLRESGLFVRGTENRVVVREVSHSMQELIAARETLRRDYGTNAVRSTGFLEETGRLWVVLDESEQRKTLEEALDPVLRDVPADIPISLSFGFFGSESACDSRRFCGGGSTRRAGIGIRREGTAPGEKACTTGFAFKNPVGDEFLTTAGHCFYDFDSAVIRTWNGTDGLWIGTLNNVNPYKYPVAGVTCDCRLIQVSDSLTQNVLYKSDTAKWRTVTAKTLYSSTNDIVKMFGAKSNTQVQGLVKETGVDIDGTNWATCACFMFNTTQATYPDQGGDSGGAVTRNTITRAAGIHSGSNTYKDSNNNWVTRRRFFDVGLMENAYNLNGVVMTTPD